MAESKSPRVLLAAFVEFGNNKIKDLFNIPMWTMGIPEPRDPPLTSVAACAIVFGLCDLLRGLLEEGRDDALNSNPPLLHLTILKGRLYVSSNICSIMLHTLLEHGANIHEKHDDSTAFETILQRSMHVSGLSYEPEDLAIMVKYFLHAGQGPNVKIKYRRGMYVSEIHRSEESMLHLAALNQNIDMIKILLEHGADINSVNESSYTPLDRIFDRDHYPRSAVSLGELINEFLAGPEIYQLDAMTRQCFEAASILCSNGGRFGTGCWEVNETTGLDRTYLTEDQIDGLKAKGICKSTTLWNLQSSCAQIRNYFVPWPTNT